ncbi:MAG: DMT family transporter [Candidatus Tectomicrobia bacterium]|uniref:DMT family transporter n=1 Tax=Tectimicrobiota bacterium TaxID=2528274 RepID=A0A932HXG2_UNCTE|nr:DMT family transporter [Candidatus Tectomicrobia bacterium]
MIFDAALLFALGAALSYAVADMGARYSVQHTSPFIAVTFSRAVSLVVLGAIALASGAAVPPLGWHYLWVVAGGICTPGLFTLLFMFGISKIGVSRAAPIKGSSPVFASLLAILFLGEEPRWYGLAGVLLVVAGIVLLSSGKTQGRWRRIDALWPIAAAAVSGLGAIFWRTGLSKFPDASVGALLGMVASFLLVGGYTFLFMRGAILKDMRKAWRPLLIMGLAASMGAYFFAGALQRGEVYRMTALIQTSPLLTVLFALALLRQVEYITWRVPAGAAVTVAGAVLVNLK